MFPFGLGAEHLDYLASNERFCTYLDMPLQHADREVLLKMRRPTGAEKYLEHLRMIRERWPGVAIRSTFLVGHPGEGEKQFQTLCDFVESARLQWGGVFEYSPEDGTPSASMGDEVAPEVAAERAERLRLLIDESRDLTPFRLGEVRDGLVVERGVGFLACRTATEAPEIDGAVFIPDDGEVEPGDFIKLRVDAVDGFDFTGVRIVEPAGVTAPAAASQRG